MSRINQIAEYARDRQLSIAGYYEAGESAGETPPRPNAMAKAVATKMTQHFPQACILVVNNQSMRPPYTQCVESWVQSGVDWSSAGYVHGNQSRH